MPSGGILIQVSMQTAPTGARSPWASQIVGFTTADADVVATIDGVNSITFQHGLLATDAITRNGDLDVSKAKGGLATALSGSFAVLDGMGFGAVDWTAGDIPLLNATVYRAWINSSGTIYKQDQLQIQSVNPSNKRLTIALKSALYINTPQLYKSQVSIQINVDPYNPQAPTDPNYSTSLPIAQNAGYAFGNKRITIKSIKSLVSQKIAMFGTGRYGKGAMGPGMQQALNVITTGTLYHTPGTIDGYQPSGSFVSTLSWIDFVLEPDFDAVYYPNGAGDIGLLKGRITKFFQSGYKIIASDGNWFYDCQCGQYWTGTTSDYRFLNGTIYSLNGKLIIGDMTDHGGTKRTILRVITSDIPTNQRNNVPSGGLDPTQVSLYAVPSQLLVSGNQTSFLGFGSAPLPGVTNTDQATSGMQSIVDGTSGVISVGTLQSSPDGYLAATPIVANFYITNGGPGLSVSSQSDGGAILWAKPDVAFSIVSADFSGSTFNINQNPNTPALSTGLMFGFTGLNPIHNGVMAELMIYPHDVIGSYDLFQIDTGFTVQLQVVTGETAGVYDLFLNVLSPGQKNVLQTIPIGFTGGVSGETHNYAISKSVSPLPSVNWDDSTSDPKDLGGTWANVPAGWNGCPGALAQIGLNSAPTTGKINLHFNVRDMVLWGFKKISGSNPDVVVWPFPITDPIAGLADYGQSVQLLGVTTTKYYKVTPIDMDLAWTLEQDLTSDADGLNTLKDIAVLDLASGGYKGIAGTNDSGSVFIWLTQISDFPYETLVKIKCPLSFAGTLIYFGADSTTISGNGTAFWFGFSGGTIIKFVPNSGGTGGTWTVIAASGAAVNGMGSDGTSKWYFALANGHAWQWNGSTGTDVAVDTALYSMTYCQTSSAFLAAGTSGIWRKTSGSFTLVNASWVVALTAVGNTVVGCLNGKILKSIDGGVSWTIIILSLSDSIGKIVYTASNGGHFITFGAASYTISVSGSDLSRWVPHGANSPGDIIEYFRQSFWGGINSVNPLVWGHGAPNPSICAISFDPPSGEIGGVTIDNACAQICNEAWIFAGENSTGVIDARNDVIQIKVPDLIPGDINDVCTLLTIQYQKWAGGYLRLAYIRNVDKAWDPTKPTFFFDGFDSDGWSAAINSPYISMQGYAIWAACRAAYLATGILVENSISADSIHDPLSLGSIWAFNGSLFGPRYAWLCKQPRYLPVVAYGNDSASALANPGSFYQVNQTILNARGLSVPAYGIVTKANHDLGKGEHTLEIAYQPA